MDMTLGDIKLSAVHDKLMESAQQLLVSNATEDYRKAAACCKAAAAAAGRIRGTPGVARLVGANLIYSKCLMKLGDVVAGVEAACAARESAVATRHAAAIALVLFTCSSVASAAPEEMAAAMGRRSTDACPVNPWFVDATVDPSRLALGFSMASVAVCERAPKALIPLELYAQAVGTVGSSLTELDEQPQQSMQLHRHAVTLCRRAVQCADSTPLGGDLPRLALIELLGNLGTLTGDLGMAESEVWLREALGMCDSTVGGQCHEIALRNLVNLELLGQLESTAFRLRLKTLDTNSGRSPQTTCAICLDDFDDHGCDGRGVQIVTCGHQFHRSCIRQWFTQRPTCPTCREVCAT